MKLVLALLVLSWLLRMESLPIREKPFIRNKKQTIILIVSGRLSVEVAAHDNNFTSFIIKMSLITVEAGLQTLFRKVLSWLICRWLRFTRRSIQTFPMSSIWID